MLRALPANVREENFGNRCTVYLMTIDSTVIVQIFYIRVYRDSFVELWCRLVYEGHMPSSFGCGWCMLHVVTGSRGAYRVRVSKLLGCALSVLLCPAAGYG